MLQTLSLIPLLVALLVAGPAPCSAWQAPVVALADLADSLPNDGNVFGLDVGPQAVADSLRAHGLPTNQIDLSINVLLVRRAHRVMLFDSGLGAPASRLTAQLTAQGVRPEAVTDVFITHAHKDHIGGLLRDGKPAFPQARIHMAQREWDWWRSTNRDAAMVQAIAPHITLFTPGPRIAPGVRAVELSGHTPGHTGFLLRYRGGSLLDMGDVAHSSVLSLAHPEWRTGFDEEPAAVGQRMTTLARLARSGQCVFAPHFPYPGLGRIQREGTGFVWRPALAACFRPVGAFRHHQGSLP